MSHYHAVIWMDHREARVFEFNAEDVEATTVHPDNPARHLHHKAGSMGPGHAPEDLKYFDAIADAVADAGEILVVGPGQAKTHFKTHIDGGHHPVKERIVGVETVDHPSDGQIVAFARKYFDRVDRMLPQTDRPA